MDELIELLREASALGYAGRTSIVDKLLGDGWCVKENLAFGYEALRDSDRPTIMVFFELPYQIELPDRRNVCFHAG